MSERDEIQRLRRLTVEAMARVAPERDRRLRSGDVFVSPLTRAFPVEWAVLEDDHGDSRVLVVAADTLPLVGRADVAVGANEGGPLNLRCGYALWLPTAALGDSPTTGRVETAAVERARRVHDRGFDPASGQDPSDDDPEYLDWIESTIRPAHRALGVLALPRAESASSDEPY